MKHQFRSSFSTQGRRMAGARALWVANGMKKEQLGKPIIAIVNSFTQFVPGHVHLHEAGQLVKQEIEKLGCFIWSAEEGTAAFDLPDRVDPETAASREESIIDEQSRVIDAWCESMVGKKIEVMTEGFDRLAECYYGRSQGEAPEIDGKIFFDTDGKKLRPGEFVKVEITDFMDCDLVGHIV